MSDVKFLSGQHAIVTGGGRGIGAAISAELARLGVNLTLMGRDLHTLKDHASLIAGKHEVKVGCVPCDVGDPASVKQAFQDAQITQGPAQILVNNAGIGEVSPLAEMPLELWERILRVNLTGLMLCTQQVLPAMLAARAGRVVNIASTAGTKGFAGLSAYTASKHGVIGLTRTLALEVAKHGITVNAVCPSFTDTDMVRNGAKKMSETQGIPMEQALGMMSGTIPRGTLITTDEVASCVGWLCSPGASGVSGECIVISGGLGH
ncbi:MAG: SDR family oxidoreductase [Acidobacteriales bacterium]|nr:SDR family oxidoreductase [Terriglobales bacterium]